MLTPTAELCQQVLSVARGLAQAAPVRSCAITGRPLDPHTPLTWHAASRLAGMAPGWAHAEWHTSWQSLATAIVIHKRDPDPDFHSLCAAWHRGSECPVRCMHAAIHTSRQSLPRACLWLSG